VKVDDQVLDPLVDGDRLFERHERHQVGHVAFDIIDASGGVRVRQVVLLHSVSHSIVVVEVVQISAVGIHGVVAPVAEEVDVGRVRVAKGVGQGERIICGYASLIRILTMRIVANFYLPPSSLIHMSSATMSQFVTGMST
jgi:hypothetical protein